MVSQEEILKALSQVKDPEIGRDIVSLGMVKELVVDKKGKVSFTLALTIRGCPLREQIAENARQAVRALPGIKDCTVKFGEMTDEEKQALRSQANIPKLSQFNQIGQVLAVMSGKGGVGKSSVTALLAVALARRGLKVGILDADITGPSIPRMFGLKNGQALGNEMGILPAASRSGIRVMSINLLLPEEDAPVVWRGPMISGAIRQFWSDVIWGKLDVLLVDLPPGTSDATLTVMQSIPLNGVVMVTTPQDLAGMVVRKGIRMLQTLNIPVVGLVENMSYFTCPDTGKRHELFGPGHADEIAGVAGAPLWARLPIDPKVAAAADAGQIETVSLEEAEAMAELVKVPA